ncbi:hypothetical protein KAR91_42290 [Candidatus Pacearchaeota archaeon]|nr:hypothetical protein [Candidatus Pacearchaeota archaeon]
MNIKVVVLTIFVLLTVANAVTWYIRRRRFLRQLKVTDQMSENLDNYTERQNNGSAQRNQNKAS